MTRTRTASGWQYNHVEGWVFNNMVRFSTSHYAQYTGTGSSLITLPVGATELYVQAAHQGSGNFAVWGLDASNSQTDLAINEIGPSRASGAIGIFDDDTVKLEVTANGSWSITVSPLSAAPKLGAQGASGTGSAVLWYYGDPRSYTVSSKGEGYVGIWQWGSEDSKLLVNQVGPYSGQVGFLGGPSVLEIDADGEWKIS
ncbi:hypothetical protein LKO27_08580 [Tessaracoccus sp. OS52]|uniref:hypothetical protein n=1 Tax=Tessaracoccus sp. OS52 TaxID=2886691 RepID=UPI001D1246E5|nr:hypothetical protein [Tessaracoccus sp. OS52]MCC2593462.1 hypothetical protein [Tessaracoccus sp. OS52]